MTWSRTNWFRCLCWAVSYLLFFDTLSMSALRYVPGWPRLDVAASSQVSAAEDPTETNAQGLSGLPGGLGTSAAAAGRILHVNATDGTCGGLSPCFRTIQGAIGSALSGDRVLIHPGQYPEQLRIFDKNDKASASEIDRIVIEADPAAPFGSVVVGPLAGARCPKGALVDIKRSSFVTLRGLVFRNAGGKGLLLRGQGRGNEAIHVERNRISADGDSRCSRGISIWHGNKDTLIANNLIDGTDREAIYVTDDRDGVHTIVSNTLYANKRGGILLARRHRAVLANNLIIANGEERSGRRGGIQRRGRTPGPEGVTLLSNLVCGNEPQEIKGVLLDRTDAGNLTPTGTEGSGVSASPGCNDLENVFAGMFEQRAAAKQTEEFRLAAGSPAIDAGVGLVEALPNIPAALLRADLMRSDAVRPADGDDDGESDYDMGAIENGEPGEATPTPTPSPTPSRSPSPSPSASPTPSPTSSPSPSAVPTSSPSPSPGPTPIPNRFPEIKSSPVTRIVVAVPDVDPPEPDFDFIEYTPTDLGSSRGDVFTTLPTSDPTVFGFNGSDVRKVNFDKRPDGTDIASGTQLTNEYASMGVLMSSIPVSSGVYGGAASPPNATFIGPIGGQQSFTFTVPVVAVGIINTSPDQDRIQFFSPSGELMFTIRDQDSLPGPNFNVDRFVGARVTDSNLIGSILFQNEAGNDEFDELIFEVSTSQLPRADYRYDVDAMDPDVDPLEYSLVDGPDGMDIDPVSGLVTWTPTSLDVGTHPVQVRVEDGRGGFDEQSYDLEVVEQPKIPLVIGETEADAREIIEAAGFAVGAVTFQVHAEPAGTVFGQSPLAGTSAPSGTAVDIAVSIGPVATPSPAPTPTPTLAPGAPLANEDEYSVAADQVLDVPAPGVLENDTDANHDPLTAMLVDGPSSGDLDLRSDGSFHFDPLGSRGKAFVYCEDFEDDGKPLSEWSTQTRTISPPSASGLQRRKFLGELGSQTVSLSLDDLPPHSKVTVAFNLFTIGSWDGNNASAGPDLWNLGVQGGPSLLATSFANVDGGRQAYPDAYPGGDHPARTGSEFGPSLGYSAEEIYPISRTFDHSESTLTLDFSASGLSSLAEESWGLDNVCVSIGAPLEAKVEFRKDYFFTRPESFQVMMAPAVADLDGDGVPEIVFSTFTGGDYGKNGILRAQSMASTYKTNIDLAREAAALVTAPTLNEFNWGRVRAFDGDETTSFIGNPNGPPFNFDIELRGDSIVRGIHMVGDRPFNDALANDFLTGNFILYDANGAVLYDTGLINFPAPDREVTLNFPDVSGVRKVRFTSSNYDGGIPGFVEYQVFGDGPIAGYEMFAVTDPEHEVSPGAQVAIGDIDLDGRPEIIAVQEDNTGANNPVHLIAFEDDGTFKWLSEVVPGGSLLYAAPSIADLDQDGTPEIVIGATALNADGTIRWFGGDVGGLGRADGYGYTAYSTIADLDLDGSPEVVAGKSAYRANGALYWNSTAPDGYPAVANLDDDAYPEIVVAQNSTLWILEHDGTVKVGPVGTYSGMRGPPTIADLDGDGIPEIGAQGGRYTVSEPNGHMKWGQPTGDGSLVTGSSVFDFDGDGTSEVVYADEHHLFIYRGATGEVLQSIENSNATLYELPVVVDADADGQAEIVLAANTTFGGTNMGIAVIGAKNGDWVPTRKIWNQHTYHVTNVNEDGSIPRVERPNWLTAGLNDFRRNAFSPDDQERTETFTYKANDGTFDSNVATVTVNIAAANGPPEIVSEPVTNAYIGSQYVYGVIATDPDVGDELKYFLPVKPDGMEIDPENGQITWAPESLGQFDVTVRVQDEHGLTDTQSFKVTVAAATPVPSASPTPSASPKPSPSATPSPAVTATPSPSPAPEIVEIVVEPEDQILLAGEEQPYTATAVFADDTSANVTGNVVWDSSDDGIASITAGGVATGLTAGTTTISATLGSISGSTTLTVASQAPGDTVLPVAAITSPEANAEITSPIEVVGTATDANFLRYDLEIGLAGGTVFTPITSGATPVTNGVLGTLDPTLLVNDLYTLRLTVFDRGGNQVSASIVVQIAKSMKVGEFTVQYTDLNVPMSGLPIAVQRVYDSRDKRSGDFGVGWHLEIQTMRIRTNRVLGTGWVRNQSGASVILSPTDEHKVSVTLPGGRVEEFDMKVEPTSGFGALDATNVTGFTARPGTLGRLEALANASLLIFSAGAEDELVDDSTFNTYAPQLFRYTAVDGTETVIHITNGVQSLREPNGNTLTFGPDGVVHSAGKSVLFTRDLEGRITELTDPRGKTQAYGYDARGDLVSHTDAEGNVTRLFYDRRHNLIRVEDPLGRIAARNEYDDNGRLVGVTDAAGNRLSFTHDVAGREEVVTNRRGHASVYSYDEAGNVLSVTNPLGETTSYTYDDRGNVLTTTNPLGHTTTFDYDDRDNLTSATDPLGHTSTATYDGQDRMLTSTDALGHTTTFTYDANGNPKTTKDALGHTTATDYDGAGNPTELTDPLGHVSHIEYDGVGNRSRLIDNEGHVTEMTHDANGNLLTQGDGVGPAWTLSYDGTNRPTQMDVGPLSRTLEYDAGGQVSRVTTPSGEEANFGYDPRGLPTAVTPTSGEVLGQTHDAEGNLLTQTDPAGNVTQYTYDAANRLTKTRFPDGTEEQRAYDAAGQLIRVTDALGHATRFEYDDAGRQVRMIDAMDGVTEREFDAAGNLVKSTDPLGRETRFTRDLIGQVIETEFADASVEKTKYDANRRVVEQEDAAGHKTMFDYDVLGRLTSVTDALNHTTTFEYNDAGLRSAIVDANSHRTTFTYDGQGRLTETEYPGGNTESVSYDTSGRVLSTTNGNGETLEYDYGAHGRPSELTLPGGSTETYTYTSDGLLQTVTDERGVTTFAYEPLTRRLSRVTEPDGRYVRYEYDAVGNRKLMAHAMTSGGAEEVTRYEYDALNRMVKVTDPSAGVTLYGYDAVGNQTKITRPNGTETTMTYDDRDRLISVTHEDSLGTTLAAETYTLDLSGNRSVVEVADGSRVEYDYDATHKVIAERHYDPADVLTTTVGYTYDAVGNQLTRTGSLGAATFTYNSDNQLISGDGITYGYDDAGNLISETASGGSVRSYTYDARGRLVEHEPPSGAPTSYTYDFRGIRQGKSGPGGIVNFLVDRANATGFEQVVRESDSVGGTLRSYTYGSQRLEVSEGGDTSYFHGDGLGSTRLLTDDAGLPTDTYSYSAYGQRLAHAGSSTNAFQFAGEQQDAESSLYYLRARHYNPAIGRFLSRDPAMGNDRSPLSLNKYLYAHANPVNLTDPSGLFTGTLIEVLSALKTQATLRTQQVLKLKKAKEKADDIAGEIGRLLAVGLIYTAFTNAATEIPMGMAFYGPATVSVLGRLALFAVAADMLWRDAKFISVAFNNPEQGNTFDKAFVLTAPPSNLALRELLFATPPPPAREAYVYMVAPGFFSLNAMPTPRNLLLEGSIPGVIVHEFVHVTFRSNDYMLYTCPVAGTLAQGSRLGAGGVTDEDFALQQNIRDVILAGGAALSAVRSVFGPENHRCFVEGSAVGAAAIDSVRGLIGGGG